MAYSIDLSGRVAFVTGASSGLGAQFARTLAAAGAGVVLAARRVDRLKTLRAEIESQGGDAHVVTLDVTDTDSIAAAVACARRSALTPASPSRPAHGAKAAECEPTRPGSGRGPASGASGSRTRFRAARPSRA